MVLIMMTTPDVNVYLVDFPDKGKEIVVPNEDGTYTILINARLSSEGQVQAYEHAMRHIENNDFEKTDVQDIEATAHEIVKKSAQPVKSDYFEKILARLKRDRIKVEKEFKEYQAREEALREFCRNYDIDYEALKYARMEHSYLYGNDL